MPFDRKRYFDAVRGPLFNNAMTQQQVDGQEIILTRWEQEREPSGEDIRFLAYELATTKHETASTMWPIEEYGKGKGHKYGECDVETGQTYFGRGFCQLTWRDNYAHATHELGLEGSGDDLEWHAERALDPGIAAAIMFRGMSEGWFRPPHKLEMFFNASREDPYGAREIINGDKHVVGNVIANYYFDFLEALAEAAVNGPQAKPQTVAITIEVQAPPGVVVTINGKPIEVET